MIASYQIGIHLRHFLSDEAEGKRLRRIILVVSETTGLSA
jgi:hypothetical protein